MYHVHYVYTPTLVCVVYAQYMYGLCLLYLQSGSHISSYMDNPGGKLQKTLARIGMDAVLDMVSIPHVIHYVTLYTVLAYTIHCI